jgi:hypothetical protein
MTQDTRQRDRRRQDMIKHMWTQGMTISEISTITSLSPSMVLNVLGVIVPQIADKQSR